MMNKNFKIVELQQGTDDWKKWRNDGIGASDAPIIMNQNPYKNIKQLLVQKFSTDFRTQKNSSMALGTKLEPIARQKYIEKKGIRVEPVCIQSKQYDWLRASLDGFEISHRIIVEIKCGKSTYIKTRKTYAVPLIYYGQLQHILAITGFGEIDFFCYLPRLPELLITVRRNDEYIERLLKRELEFWNYFNQKINQENSNKSALNK